jgi:hypothetical protein
MTSVFGFQNSKPDESRGFYKWRGLNVTDSEFEDNES